MALKDVRPLALYPALAAAAGAANLLAREQALRLGASLLSAVVVGTEVGLVVKYERDVALHNSFSCMQLRA